MRKILSLFLIVFTASCSTARKPAPPLPYPPNLPVAHNKMQSPRGREASKLSAAPVKQFTNTLGMAWSAPELSGVTNYGLYFGTNSGRYLSKVLTGGNTNQYTLTTILRIISTTPPVRTRTFPNGFTVTNGSSYYYSMTALYDLNVLRQMGLILTNSESPFSNEIMWPPPPAPPWNAIVLVWGTNSVSNGATNFVPVSKNVTVQMTTNILSKSWTTATNVTGTGVTLPFTLPASFYRLMTTNPPPLVIQSTGGYL